MDDARYRNYFEAMSGYVTVQDRDFRIIDANNRFREDFGDWEGLHCYQVYKGRLERCEVCPVARTFEDGERHDSEEQVRTQDGREVSTLVYSKPVRDDSGEISSVMEVSTDITHIKLLYEALRSSEHRYHSLFDSVPCYISVQDAELNIVETNRAFEQAFGPSLGRKCYQAYKHRAEPCVPCPVQETLEDGLPHTREELVTSLDGKHRNVLVTTTPIHGGNGQLAGVMEMSADITEVRELETRLTSLGLLIGSVSHGLKGLLNGLAGGMYLVDSGFTRDDPARVEKGWKTVHRNVARIKTMVSDILYYAKDRTPHWEPFSVLDLVDEVVALQTRRADDLDVELFVEVEADAGALEADGQAVRSMLTNLVENALDACRLNRNGNGTRVSVAARDAGARVRFEVSDNGVGMDQETVEKALTLFFSSKGTGTGLGLFIAHKIAQAHGGSVELESEPGLGTRVWVELPRARPPDPEPEDKTLLEEDSSHG
jgi:PAS domain S-box-containing protein